MIGLRVGEGFHRQDYTGRLRLTSKWQVRMKLTWSCEFAQCITPVEPVQLTVISSYIFLMERVYTYLLYRCLMEGVYNILNIYVRWRGLHIFSYICLMEEFTISSLYVWWNGLKYPQYKCLMEGFTISSI